MPLDVDTRDASVDINISSIPSKVHNNNLTPILAILRILVGVFDAFDKLSIKTKVIQFYQSRQKPQFDIEQCELIWIR